MAHCVKRLVQKFGAEMTQRKWEHPLVIRHHDERAVRLKNISVSRLFFRSDNCLPKEKIIVCIVCLFLSFVKFIVLVFVCVLDLQAVEGFDPAEVELSMMRLSPVWGLIESVAHQKNRNSCWMVIKQQLQHYCTDGQKLPNTVEY